MSKTTTKNQNQNIPKLRFPGFDGVWIENRLGDIFKRITKKNVENNQNILTISAQQGLINQEEFFTKLVSSKDVTGYYLLSNGDFAYNKSYSKGYPVGAIKRLTKFDKGVVSTLYICFSIQKNFSGDYFEQYFDSGSQNREISKVVQEGARNHGLLGIAVNDFFDLVKIPTPTFPEQQKIASFLGSVDEWIGNLKEQKKQLEDYKRGMMQKIFSQQIRFKDENGKDFAEWEEKKLGNLGETYNGLTGKTAEDFGEGEPFITYKQIFDNSELDVTKFSFVQVSENEKQNKAQFGDVFFTTSSETPLEVGFASVLLHKNINPFLNSFSFGFRLNKNLDPYFAKFLFRSSVYRREVVKLAQGSTRYNISKIEFLKIKLTIPEIKEQQKIAELLSSVDQLLESKQQQITEAETWKKGLMQGLFI
jgi:type I restriction enzyme S subunit